MTKTIRFPLITALPSSHLKLPNRGDLRQRWSSTLILPLLITLLILIPIALLALNWLSPSWELWEQLWATILPNMLKNTAILVIGVGVGTLILGTGMAWLTSAYEFPLRGWFDRLLLLPLAIPGFVMGFVFMATFDYAGSVQTTLRQWFGADIVFPDIRSAGGVIVVLTLVLYPYVYLLARTAFREQSATTFEAAQVMGMKRWQIFMRLVLPMARPSLVAGSLLAMMEALTDYGTVSFFSYPTLSEGIVRIWDGRMDRAAAAELASLLLLMALGLMVLERSLRGQAQYHQQGGGARGRRPDRVSLRGWGRWGAVAACTVLLSVAFVLPVMQLGAWVIAELQVPSVGAWRSIYGTYIMNSMTLAGAAAFLVTFLALLVAHGIRSASVRNPNVRMTRWIARLATLGYAMPGAMLAVGVLNFLAPIDFAINDWAKAMGLDRPGLILTGTMTGLVYAYVVRFMAVGYSSVDASLEKVTPNMDHAARTLGANPMRVLWRIHVPLLSVGMATGAILVFVDVMKELPTTLMLRPFGMDTLALWAYFLAAESFWQAAAIPSLTILVMGLVPVLILMRIGEQRPHA